MILPHHVEWRFAVLQQGKEGTYGIRHVFTSERRFASVLRGLLRAGHHSPAGDAR
jgi:hypothetical protein